MNHVSKLNQKYLLVPKSLYFTLSAAFYAFHQFRGQFIVDRFNMEKSTLGFYLSIPQSISFISNIWIGSINDSSGQQKTLIVTLLLASAVFFQSFFMTNSLANFWIGYTCYFSLLSATLPLLDKVMLDYVSEIPGMGSKAFGSQRVWSTFGYLVTNFTVEHMISVKGSDDYDYNSMQYFNIVAVIAAATLLFLFVSNIPRRSTVSHNHFGAMKPLLKNFEYMYFIFIILLSGISRAFMTNYLGIYHSKVLKLKSQDKNFSTFWPLDYVIDSAYKHKQATSTLFGVALEIIVFLNSSYVFNKLGYFWPILLAQIFQLLRFVAYYNLSYENENSFILCCLIEMLKGANYSLIHLSALQLANSFCPPHLKTTSQLVYNGTFVALGTILSGLVFKGLFSDDTDNVEKTYAEFNNAFKWNIVFSIVSMLFFVVKYGVFENLLFSSENARLKILKIEEEAKKEEDIENKLNEKDLNELEKPEVAAK